MLEIKLENLNRTQTRGRGIEANICDCSDLGVLGLVVSRSNDDLLANLPIHVLDEN